MCLFAFWRFCCSVCSYSLTDRGRVKGKEVVMILHVHYVHTWVVWIVSSFVLLVFCLRLLATFCIVIVIKAWRIYVCNNYNVWAQNNKIIKIINNSFTYQSSQDSLSLPRLMDHNIYCGYCIYLPTWIQELRMPNWSAWKDLFGNQAYPQCYHRNDQLLKTKNNRSLSRALRFSSVATSVYVFQQDTNFDSFSKNIIQIFSCLQ